MKDEGAVHALNLELAEGLRGTPAAGPNDKHIATLLEQLARARSPRSRSRRALAKEKASAKEMEVMRTKIRSEQLAGHANGKSPPLPEAVTTTA